MKGPGKPGRRIGAAAPKQQAERTPPPKDVVQPAPTGGGPDPVAEAAAAVQAAYDRVQDCEAAVEIARAQLEEQRAAAPRLSPRLADAVAGIETAREAEAAARVHVADAERAVQDKTGQVRVTTAALEDLGRTAKPVTLAQQAGAEEKHEKAVRDETAARARLDAAQRDGERAGHQLAAAEEHLEQVKSDRGPGPSKVLAAQAKVDKAVRDRDAAQVAYAATQERHHALRKAADEGDPTVEPHRQHFQSLEEFVTDYVLENWERKNTSDDGDLRWCALWWEHPEAIARLEHVWEAFEAARREPPPAMSSWWRDHLDHHMGRLTDPRGPFEQCDHTNGTHVLLDPWGSQAAPAGLFEDNLESETAIERRKVRSIAKQRGTKTVETEGVSA